MKQNILNRTILNLTFYNHNMQIIPVGNRVVVQLIKQKNTSSSGFIIASEEKNEQLLGEIIAIGSGNGTDENVNNLDLAIGQTVMFGKYSGEEINDRDNLDITYKIIKGEEVLAIIKK
jgi:chaperonin GroES